MSPSFYRSPRGRSTRALNEKGFTLIELIVVTFLIGIMLSISIPSLRNAFFNDPLKATARKIIGLVTGVRELAVRSQQPYLLHISQLENRIWYEKEAEGKENAENDTSYGNEISFPESVKISEILTGDSDSSSKDGTVIWISKQGYMIDTIVRINDNDGNHLNVQFYPFLDPALISDKAATF